MFQWPQEKPCPKAYASLERVIEIQSKKRSINCQKPMRSYLLNFLIVFLSLPAGKHWSCLQSLSQTSGHSLLDGPLGAQGQSEKDEAETVSAMASLSVDVEQPGSVPDSTETSRSAVHSESFMLQESTHVIQEH